MDFSKQNKPIVVSFSLYMYFLATLVSFVVLRPPVTYPKHMLGQCL